MNVFADLHQDDLYWSLHLLFERRLGWKLFRPLGIDWWTSRFWEYSLDLRVVNQYLRPRGDEIAKDGYNLSYEERHDYYHRTLSFEQFKKYPIDIVIASVSEHEALYKKLVDLHKPNAKFIRQVGNNRESVNFYICKNVMASVKPFSIPEDVNAVFYHQEFDTKLFTKVPTRRYNRITNLMNCLPDSPDYPLYLKFKEALPDYEFKMYGILGDDGIIGTTKGVAEAFKDTTFVWHVKHQGDGFGHIIHNAFACGRPPIVIKKYYKDTLAEDLMIDGKTCICLDDKPFKQCIDEIRYFSKPENFDKMSQQAYDKFRELVNYDQEFIKIKEFLNRLK